MTEGLPVASPLSRTPTPDQIEQARKREELRAIAGEVMDIVSTKPAPPEAENERFPASVRVLGHLRIPADEAFDFLRPRFEALGHTPMLREAENMQELRAIPVVFSKGRRPIQPLVIILLVATIITVFLAGVSQADDLYNPPLMVFAAQITGNADLLPYPDLAPTPEQWRAALLIGVQYMLALLGILGAHEMGHYLVARHYRVDTTPPFFIPMPISFLGTLGAVIAMREPAPNRRIQFDIGVAGPLAGLIVAIPVIIIGLMMSDVGTAQEFLSDLPPQVAENMAIMHEGQSLAYLGLKYLVFGEWLPSGGRDVWIHPVAFAGWAGLLVTALNLLPLGQLDGGHVVYGLFGRAAEKLRGPIIAVLILLGAMGSLREALVSAEATGVTNGILTMLAPLANAPIPGWSGWFIWVAFGVFLLRTHAPVLNEITDLDPRRKAVGIAVLIIFILIFMPTPLVIDQNFMAVLHTILPV